MALCLYIAKAELKKAKEEKPELAKEVDELIENIDKIGKSGLSGKYEEKIDLSKIISKEGKIRPKALEQLEYLIKKGAVFPDGAWLHLPSSDGFASKLYDSGLLERVEVECHNEYRVKELDLVKELLNQM